MKNFKTALIILFAVVIVILIFFLVKNINNNNNSSQNDKMISEINFMDSKLTSLLNGVNNITLENYKITVTKTSTNSNQSSTSSAGTSSSQSGGQNGGQSSQESSGGQSRWRRTKWSITEVAKTVVKARQVKLLNNMD